MNMDNLSKKTVVVHKKNLNDSKKIMRWIFLLLLLFFMASSFNLSFVILGKKIVCNKSKNICSLYTKNIIQTDYKEKEKFPMSEIIGVDYSVHWRHIAVRGHSNKYKKEYRVYIYNRSEPILVKITTSENKAIETIKNIRRTLKTSDMNNDFVLYEKPPFQS